MLRAFGVSIALTLVGLGVGLAYGGVAGLIAVAILLVLEISLSFDNAVVNAKVLKNMSRFWRNIFLTVGILIAVVGVRLVLPILLVAITAGLGFGEVIDLALNDSETYSKELKESEAALYAFGGTFLFMIFLDFMFDQDRDIQWLKPLERALARVGRLESLSVLVALAAIFTSYSLAVGEEKAVVLLWGVAGLFVYLLISGLSGLLGSKEDEMAMKELTGKAGFLAFCYLEVLDASFSFDGVIGAFAISSDVVIIAIGLGVGAYWVRSMTVYLVKKGTLSEYVYLEHGAHWAIGILATIMLAHVKFSIPEVVTGLSGVLFIAAALVSSVIEKKREAEHAGEGDGDGGSGGSGPVDGDGSDGDGPAVAVPVAPSNTDTPVAEIKPGTEDDSVGVPVQNYTEETWRCSGITRAGKQCSKRAVEEGRCVQHPVEVPVG